MFGSIQSAYSVGMLEMNTDADFNIYLDVILEIEPISMHLGI